MCFVALVRYLDIGPVVKAGMYFNKYLAEALPCTRFCFIILVSSETRAVNSEGECFLDAEEATSSNLVRPTIKLNRLRGVRPRLFYEVY